MLERIKLILGLKDDTDDDLIILYITKYTDVVLAYLKLNKLNDALESFIEDKVIACVEDKVGAGGTGGIENNGEIKAITRGDTKIEYNVSSGTVVAEKPSKGAFLTESDRKYLDSFKMRSWRLL